MRTETADAFLRRTVPHSSIYLKRCTEGFQSLNCVVDHSVLDEIAMMNATICIKFFYGPLILFLFEKAQTIFVNFHFKLES